MITQFTAAGTHHTREGVENQDAYAAAENEQYSVAVLADGVSSCSQARRGAQLACDTVARLLLGCPDFFMNATHDEIVRVILRNVLHALETEAAADGLDAAEYSSTLSFALHEHATGAALLFQLGDGLILGCRGEDCIPLIQPGTSRNGTCVTTTRNAKLQCVTRFLTDEEAESIVLLTDGAWRSLVSIGELHPDAARALCSGEYDDLQDILDQTQPQDDHTILIMNP